MPTTTRVLYEIPGGDRWSLAKDSDRGVFIRHEANVPSGGKVTEIELGIFLVASGMGPEKQELMRLIGTLVGEGTP